MKVPEGVKLSLIERSMLHKESPILKTKYVAAATDLAIATGVAHNDIKRVPGDWSKKGRRGSYLFHELQWIDYISNCGMDIYRYEYCGIDHSNLLSFEMENLMIRPVLELPPDLFELVTSNRRKGPRGTWEVDFLSYGQYVPNYATQKEIEEEFDNDKLRRLDNAESYCLEYHGDPTNYYPTLISTYKDKCYVRVEVKGKNSLFSDGRIHRKGNYIWVEVQPVTWLIDDESKLLISKRGLIAGIYLGGLPNRESELDEYYKRLDYFLNTILLRDLFALATLPELKKNKASSEIVQITDEINCYKKYNLSVENIDSKVDGLISDYNSKIDKLV